MLVNIWQNQYNIVKLKKKKKRPKKKNPSANIGDVGSTLGLRRSNTPQSN